MDRRNNRPYPRDSYSSSNTYYDEDEAYENEHYPQSPQARATQEPEPEPEPPRTMSSWFQRAASSTQAQLAATAIVSGAVVAGAILGYQHVRRVERTEDLKRSIPELGAGDEGKVRYFYLQISIE